ncbi:LruC domain-containing protein [Roseivirga sp.]|uniref:LruC domain-containing protein n=1 Tax=Roseivirga sp. TaxID=1964215 RepID=UPI003B516C61
MKKYTLIAISLFVLSGCIEKPVFELEETVSEFADFDFNTTSGISLDVSLTGNDGSPFKGVKVSVYEVVNDEAGKKLFTAVTNSSGQIRQEMNLPAYYEQVLIETNFIGIPNQVIVPIQNNSILFDYEDGQLVSATAGESNGSSQGAVANQTTNINGITFNYMDAFSRPLGVPANLEPQRDVISSTLLTYINASLPESQPVPTYHPTYLAGGKKTTLDIVELADVWLTFVHEGAGWKNAIGYYTYPTDTPPQSLDDISTINIVFPNLSYQGSGGGLKSGDKVNLGRFEPGTSIGIVLLANGWDTYSSEGYYYLIFADNNLNPESDPSLRQHNVLLWDEENELFLLGFEDINREERGCDEDFNDAIMFVTSNPVNAISIENVSPVDKPGTLDTDGDGINDILDEFPNDPEKAYTSYYPSSTSFGSFAFEDNWPDYGDYDFNDLVVDYQFRHYLNADNQVVAMDSKFKVRAIGAGFRNGFGFATNLLPSDVASSTGHVVNSPIIKLNSNGTEQGQDNAVFIVSNSVHDLFDYSGFVNTQEGDVQMDPAEVTLNTVFNSPKSYAQLGNAPYNPFIIVSQDRGREVHLPGYAPTNLVDQEFFGSLDDDSDPANGIYYRSKTSLPWAIHLPESFDYPKEKSDIRQGHLRFKEWAQSFGYSYMDWYRNQTGYRNTSKLYKK